MFKADFSELRNLDRYLPVGQIRFGAALGLTILAQRVSEAEKKKMQQVFDRPTPFTLNSLQVRPARKDRLESEVRLKDPPRLSGREHYLEPQIEGGGRTLKNFESMMGKKFLMPGRGMALDQYGNIPPAQLVKLLSAMGKFGEVGYSMNRRGKRSRTNMKGQEFFVLRGKNGKLLPGIYQRTTATTGPSPAGQSPLISGRSKMGRGLANGAFQKGIRGGAVKQRGVMPMLIEGKAPSYKKRFPFYEEAIRIINEQGEEVMLEAVGRVLDTAW